MSQALPKRRNLPGTKGSALFSWNHNVSFDEIESHFNVAEYIEHMIYKNPQDVLSIVTKPDTVDREIWLYEHLRRLLQDLNGLIVALSDSCNKNSCSKMCATSDWEYLCAAHQPPKPCCAIDYIQHTISSFVSLLNNAQQFPNRSKISAKAAENFDSVVRRIYRFFAHSYYHHRLAFDVFENSTHLTKRFLALALKNGLMSESQCVPALPHWDSRRTTSADSSSSSSSSSPVSSSFETTTVVSSSSSSTHLLRRS
eukprot:TRINITY_DN109_c4_g1_i1.p1 TRINITY_DN109_c4_g1~~TRINITY_DN109_c4_g1_i1.p1  ORF type:complete len:255 (+),score=42.97 TRINITY_DN109_c4_g1_i1:89-853(+)